MSAFLKDRAIEAMWVTGAFAFTELSICLDAERRTKKLLGFDVDEEEEEFPMTAEEFDRRVFKDKLEEDEESGKSE